MKVDWSPIFPCESAWPGLQGGALQQSQPYAQAALACGAVLHRARIDTPSGAIGQAVVLQKPGRRVILRGPIWSGGAPSAERRAGLRRLARQLGVTLATPEDPVPGPGLVPLITSRHVALWNLVPEVADLRAGLSGKWRNRMITAARQGVDIRQAGPAALHLLIEVEAAQQIKRGYRGYSAAFNAALPENALRLWQWHDGGRLHAAMCFVRHGTWATYHLGYADARARAAGAHGLILWQAALALRGEGVEVLDLGDVNTEQAPGLARFKLGTGAALHRLGATSLVLPA